MAAYLTNIRRASLCAFAAMGLYLLVAKFHGRHLLIGSLSALPNLLIILLPPRCVSLIRGIAVAQSLILCAIAGYGGILGFVLGFEYLGFLFVLVFLCQFFLLRFAVGREPSDAVAKRGSGTSWLLLSAALTVIYQVCVYEFVPLRK